MVYNHFRDITFTVSLLLINSIGCLFIGGSESLPLFFIYQFFMLFISTQVLKCDYKALFIYNIIMFLANLSVVENLYNFQMQFAPYGDDSYFFLLATEQPFTNIFTLITYVFINITSLFKDKVELIDILPLIFISGTINIFILRNIIYLLTKEKLKLYFFVIALIFNVYYLDTLIHLYRDTFVTSFYLLFIWSLLKKKYIFCIISFILVAQLRVESGVLCLILFILHIVHLRTKALYRAKTQFIVVVFLVLMGIGQLTSIMPNLNISKGDSDLTYSEYLNARLNTFQEKADENQLTTKLMKSPIGQPFRPVATVISPLTAKSVEHSNFRVSTKYNSYVVPKAYLFFTEPLSWLATLLLLFIIPRLVVGAMRMYKENVNIAFLLVFIISILLVTYVSMQTRHRTMFIVFYPLLLVYFTKYKMNRKEKKIFNFTLFALVLLITFSFIRLIIL